MSDITLRTMVPGDWRDVAELIYLSTNYWYETHGRQAIFRGGAEVALVFCEEYEALDPGCCVLAESHGRIVGSCFYHPRPSHFSLGIMNAHPNYFGRGVARQLLRFITDKADTAELPVRLVSSALNLDSYALYTRVGFTPRVLYQDMVLPATGPGRCVEGMERVRDATLGDLAAIVALEGELQQLHREKDYRHFLANATGIWRVSVYENTQGAIDGVLASVAHPGSTMLGPGVARTEDQALALILAELDHHRGQSPVFLVPATCSSLVARLYALGARNCELHVHQIRGTYTPGTGILMPSFLPETA